MHTILVSLLLRQVQRTESVLQWHSQQGAPEVPLPSLHPYGSALLLLELGRGAGPGSLAPHLVTQRRVRSLAQQQLQAAETAPAGGHVQRCQPLGRSGAGVEGGVVNGGENSISAREPWPSVSYPHPPARDTTLGTQILRPRAGTLAPVLGLSGSLPRFCKLRPWASSPHPWTMRRPLLHSKASPLDSEDPPLHGRPHPEPRTRLTERWGLRLDASGL